MQEPWVPLWQNLPLPPDVSEVAIFSSSLPWSAAPKDTPGVVRFEEKTLLAVALGVLCDFFFSIFPVSAATTICGMGVFSFRQTTVATCWSGRCIPFLGALLVQVTASSPQVVRRLLAFCPDLAELLAVMALRRWVAVICLLRIMPNPSPTSPSDMSSARVLCGTWCNTAFIGFSDFR
jgi:hypothetical protein